jgi:hypothetical protein
MMNIWWCEEHKATATPETLEQCWYVEAWGYRRGEPCRMVPRRLVDPTTTLIIEKDDPRLLEAWTNWAKQEPLDLKFFLQALAVAASEVEKL